MTLARWLGSHRIDLLDCGSTNDEAARLARAGARHGTVVTAETQRAGRGRDGRAWQSPAGMGLYLSAVVRPPLPLADVPPMTLAIGVGLCDAVRSFGADAELKWPNDLLVRGKKLAGVLVEAQSQGTRLEAVIVGIGVNIAGEIPVEVAERAITLEEAAGTKIDKQRFTQTLLEHVEHWIDRYVANGLVAINSAWEERMAKRLMARAHIAREEASRGSSQMNVVIEGEVCGLDGDGALLLRDEDGTLHRVRSGDVEVTVGAC